MFRSDVSEQRALAAIVAVEQDTGADPSGQLWAVDMATGSKPSELYRYDALLVSSSLLPLGCFNWTRAKRSEA